MASAFTVETSIEAHVGDVWRALTEPEEIRRWFGWEYDGLDEEIRYIFVEHAKQHPPDRIELEDQGDGQTIELQPVGIRTHVTIARPGEPAGDDDYDEIAEGWRAFLAQLRFALERHPGEERRTAYLSGEASPKELLRAVDGETWHEGRFQRGYANDDGTLAVVAAGGPLDSDEPAKVTATITAYGVDDAELSRLRQRWEGLWPS